MHEGKPHNVIDLFMTCGMCTSNNSFTNCQIKMLLDASMRETPRIFLPHLQFPKKLRNALQAMIRAFHQGFLARLAAFQCVRHMRSWGMSFILSKITFATCTGTSMRRSLRRSRPRNPRSRRLALRHLSLSTWITDLGQLVPMLLNPLPPCSASLC